MKYNIKTTLSYTSKSLFPYISFRDFSQNKDLRPDGFKEKGSIDVTPFIDKSDGGTGYAPPLISPKLLMGVLGGVIVLFFIIAKLRNTILSIRLNKNTSIEAKNLKNNTTLNQSDDNKNQSLEVESESPPAQAMEADEKPNFDSQLTDSMTNKPIRQKFNLLFWPKRR